MAVVADVDICNMSLSHLGISVGITSLDPPDQTAQAKVLAFWYPKVRDQVLQAAPWNFANKYQAMVSDASNVPGTRFAFPGWQFALQYPSDCLQPIALVTAAGLRFGQQYWSGYWWPFPGQMVALPKLPYKIFQSTANPGQLAIACDINPAVQPLYLIYIAQVVNTALYDPMFQDGFAYELGFKAGPGLLADPARVQMCMQQSALKRGEALAQHLNATQQDRERASPSILTR